MAFILFFFRQAAICFFGISQVSTRLLISSAQCLGSWLWELSLISEELVDPSAVVDSMVERIISQQHMESEVKCAVLHNLLSALYTSHMANRWGEYIITLAISKPYQIGVWIFFRLATTLTGGNEYAWDVKGRGWCGTAVKVILSRPLDVCYLM